MKIEVSSTEVVRNFGDCLARIKYRGDSFVIRKNQEIVAELIPVGNVCEGTWGGLMKELEGLPIDPEFADDLERRLGNEDMLENPWA